MWYEGAITSQFVLASNSVGLQDTNGDAPPTTSRMHDELETIYPITLLVNNFTEVATTIEENNIERSKSAFNMSHTFLPTTNSS